MPTISPFTPQTGTVMGTVSLAVTNSSGNVQLPTGGGTQIRIANPGTVAAFLNFGGSAVVASASSSIPILAGAVEIFTMDTSFTGSAANQLGWMAGITSSGSTTIYVTKGEGF